MRVHLLPGIHTGITSPVQGLVPYLHASGFDVVWVDYGFVLGVETRLSNPLVRSTMKPYIEAGDIVIGHSNGCAIAYDLMSVGAPFGGAVFINGALEQYIMRPVNVKFIDVYYNSGDDITEVARFAEQIGLVDPVWGELGHAGYSGHDSAIHNIDCGNTTGMPVVSGHSDFFTPSNLAVWGQFVAKRLAATGIGSI